MCLGVLTRMSAVDTQTATDAIWVGAIECRPGRGLDLDLAAHARRLVAGKATVFDIVHCAA